MKNFKVSKLCEPSSADVSPANDDDDEGLFFFQWELQVILPNTADSTIEMCGKNKSLRATSNVYLQSSRISDTHTRTYGLFQTLAFKFLSFSWLGQMLPNRQGECLLGHLPFLSAYFISSFSKLFLTFRFSLGMSSGRTGQNGGCLHFCIVCIVSHFFQQFMYNSFLISSSVTLIADSAWEMKSAGRMTNSAKAPTTRRTSVAIFAALFVYSLITVARSQENELFQCPEGEIF